MNNPLYMERLLALAWQSVAAADTTELLKALARLRDNLILRLEALADANPKAEASKEIPPLLQTLESAITDAHWCKLLRVAVTRQASEDEKREDDFIGAFNSVQLSISRIERTALSHAQDAMLRICEILKLSDWEKATLRYLLESAPQGGGTFQGGLAEPPPPGNGSAPDERGMTRLANELADVLTGSNGQP